MFKFNFIPEAENATENEAKVNSEIDASEYDECFEIKPTEEQFEIASIRTTTELNRMIFGNDHEIFHVPVDGILDELSKESKEISCAEENHSDLVAGVYEGGAKIWECTQDLGGFLVQHNVIERFANAKVLDLGCGSGVLGILAAQSGGEVHFQDYNKAVLQHITIPNVIVNIQPKSLLAERCRFFSGDWSSYVKKTESDNETFDFILTSETIYNVQSYEKIINVLETKLKPNGICYLAAKLHYFGVGGSLRHFEKVLLSKSKRFHSESVFVCNENVSREILKITFN